MKNKFDLPVIVGMFTTVILVLLVVLVFKGVVAFWHWSDAKVGIANEKETQEIFKRKECAIHYYALCEDYDKLLELVLIDSQIENSVLTEDVAK